ncbi:restriction endonuclease subunit S [Streptococcus oralis]|uniref:restriction endonuclease subunit S n=1 Tax=Streptococcus oralis TaxID=1303 RepID=UPI0002583F08|nr:restriction endonuclease subunit S [Streptococcus oralis]EIC76883.1 type I restriction modification DNA specificity domain protein [Streptococcus oralis SK100]KZX08740.1 restriction endonuclease subunit S [Streptococcus oralis]
MVKIKLGDVIDFKNGKSVKKSDGIIPIYGGNGILGYTDKSNFSHTIVVGRVGAYCGSIHVEDNSCWVSDNAIAGVPKEGQDLTYLYYVLKSLNLNSKQIGSSQPLITQSMLKDMVVDIEIDIEKQKKIANSISIIDQKIQINNQINQELEDMAKTLYDYWFVQFDFPDQNGKPYRSSGGKMVYNPELKREIPEGWEVEKLSSLLEIGRETINPMKTPKEEFKYYSIPEYDVSGSFSYELGETIRSNKFIVEKSDLLVSKLNPWFNRVVYNLEENAISSTEFIVWKTFNRFEKNFLYQVATSKEFIEYCTRFATGTSNSHKRVSPDIMVGFQIPFKKTYIQKFGEITDSIRTQVLQNNVQNQELTQLRDWLLPMLMNGQVKVE